MKTETETETRNVRLEAFQQIDRLSEAVDEVEFALKEAREAARALDLIAPRGTMMYLTRSLLTSINKIIDDESWMPGSLATIRRDLIRRHEAALGPVLVFNPSDDGEDALGEVMTNE